MPTPLDSIDTIVVVMLENRSFDNVLGYLSHESFGKRADVEGLHLHSPDFDWDNPDEAGTPYTPTATADSYLPADMPHGRGGVAQQIDSGSMLGFIKAYFAAQAADRSPSPMRFCRPQDIPITAKLADQYRVCDNWFACIPDDTFPNRLMSLCGATRIDATSSISLPGLLPEQKTIFDWLANAGKNFKIYVDADAIANVGPPASMLLMRSQWLNILKNAKTLDTLQADWKSAAKAPDVIYCEPFFNDFATAVGLHGNCNHPPLPMAFGEAFLHKVYTALTSNPAKWKKTMMIVCYDEHGGFFDHVRPPPMECKPPADHRWVDPTPFSTLGVRVPGIIVSPMVDAKPACKVLFDHTSILQLIVEKFGNPADLATLGDAATRKTHGIKSLSAALNRTTPRKDDIVQLPTPPVFNGPATTPVLTIIAKMFRAVIAAKPLSIL